DRARRIRGPGLHGPRHGPQYPYEGLPPRGAAPSQARGRRGSGSQGCDRGEFGHGIGRSVRCHRPLPHRLAPGRGGDPGHAPGAPQGPRYRGLLHLRPRLHDAARGDAARPQGGPRGRAAGPHAQGRVGGQRRCHGRRRGKRLRPRGADPEDIRRQGRARGRPRRRAPDEAPQQLPVPGLRRDLRRGADDGEEGRHPGADLRQRDPRRSHGLRLLPDLHGLHARGQPRGAQVHAAERRQGPALPGIHGQRRRGRDAGRLSREEQLRPGHRLVRRRARGLRAPSRGLDRPRERDRGTGRLALM
ncbi:MAG: 3-hydroxyisobutyrate dehydrogenase family protein, partial [uncultured Rubellimicrobium sp.]